VQTFNRDNETAPPKRGENATRKWLEEESRAGVDSREQGTFGLRPKDVAATRSRRKHTDGSNQCGSASISLGQ